MDSDSSSITHAAILASGEELVTGRRVDTNSHFIQRRLASIGISVVQCRQVGDGIEELVRCLEELRSVAPLVITTGGLGPTEDDRMRDAVARTAGVPLEEDPAARAELERFFAERGRVASPSNLRQAQLPKGAARLPNPRGTAPGFRVGIDRTSVISLPGVPFEMRGMIDEQVLPWLRPEGGEAIREISLQVVGLPESVLGERIHRWMADPSGPEVAVTAHEAWITVTLWNRDGGPELLKETEKAIRAVLEPHCLSDGYSTLEEEVVNRLIQRGETVSTAESCTGGLAAARLTEVPGASAVFPGAVVTYSNAEKVRNLAVTESDLEQHGAVSETIARAMAEGVRQRCQTTWGIGITGIAGPEGGTPDKPVGTVHVAWSGPAGTIHRRLRLSGPRGVIRLRTAVTAWEQLRQALSVEDRGG